MDGLLGVSDSVGSFMVIVDLTFKSAGIEMARIKCRKIGLEQLCT